MQRSRPAVVREQYLYRSVWLRQNGPNKKFKTQSYGIDWPFPHASSNDPAGVLYIVVACDNSLQNGYLPNGMIINRTPANQIRYVLALSGKKENICIVNVIFLTISFVYFF